MIDTSGFVTYLIAAIILVITPGTIVMFIASQCLTRGTIGGVMASLGVAFSCCFQVIAMALGLSEALARWPWLFHTIRYGGVAFLLYLAWKAFRSTELRIQGAAAASLQSIYWRGAIVNLLSPHIALFFLVFIPQFVHPENGSVMGQFFMLGSCFLILSLIGNLAYSLLFGTVFSQLARRPKFIKIASRLSGFILVGLAIKILVN